MSCQCAFNNGCGDDVFVRRHGEQQSSLSKDLLLGACKFDTDIAIVAGQLHE
jgi:hypothetical protein